MTLAKNKPILARDLDLKEIIFDAYENGKLRTIIPFVSKILEHCLKTKVFHPKNPWLQAILSLFNELFLKPNLYHNLKFEIESLFKKLDINFNDIPQSKYLEKLTIPNYSNDFSKQQPIQQETQIEPINLKDIYNKISQLNNYVNEIFSLIKMRCVPSIINQQELVKILTQALSSSISEIISPVVERAVNISLVTTKELVIKDLMFEMDEKKFQIAATNCIKSLAGSLALITCKEPLRIGYNQQLKDALLKKKLDPEFIEIVTNQSNNDLLDIGCSYIHNYVIQKAIEKIQNDEAIIKEIDRRRKGISYDIESEYVIKADLLPDILKPKITGLTPEQFKIYENFDTIYESYSKNEPSQKMTWINVIGGLLKEVLENVDPNNINKTLKNYNVFMLNMQNISHSQTNIEEGNKELQYIEKCVSESKIENVDLIKGFAEISFKFAFHSFEKKNNKLFNLYIALIKGWVSSENQISREITNLLMKNYDISMRFNLELHLKFIKNNVINMSDYEMYYLGI
jgi:CCR4-NOT transcription complex subunit 1